MSGREVKTMARAERMSEHRPESPWSVPVALHEVPETGRHLDLVADERVRAAVARLAGVTSLPRLAASFDLSPRGRTGLHVVGRVSATVGQICVVSLEPIENEVDEPIDLLFSSIATSSSPPGAEVEIPVEDVPEPLVDGSVDLGALATEFLLLGIDPYPRKPGAVFQAPAPADDTAHPFAALAALKNRRKKSQDGNRG
jgi:Large ribosomal RNA subunit accumulation protein YceD